MKQVVKKVVVAVIAVTMMFGMTFVMTSCNKGDDQNVELRQILEDLQDRINDLEERIGELEEDNAVLRKELEELQRKLEEMKSGSEMQLCSDIANRIKQLYAVSQGVNPGEFIIYEHIISFGDVVVVAMTDREGQRPGGWRVEVGGISIGMGNYTPIIVYHNNQVFSLHEAYYIEGLLNLNDLQAIASRK